VIANPTELAKALEKIEATEKDDDHFKDLFVYFPTIESRPSILH
jgi:hypothetical protein